MFLPFYAQAVTVTPTYRPTSLLLLIIYISLYAICFMFYACTKSLGQIPSNVKPLHLHGNKCSSDSDLKYLFVLQSVANLFII